MTSTAAPTGTWLMLLRAPLFALLFASLATLLAACGGSDADLPPPTGPSLIQPTDQSTAVGGSATFEVGVLGGAGATFQWQQLTGATWTDVVGATNPSLVIAGATLAQDGTQYRALVSVGGGTLISNPATLSVTPSAVAPTITTQPADQSVIEPATATFNVTASGTAPLAYQWQRLSGSTWTDIAGATGASHTTPATVRADDNGAQFRVVISNAIDAVTSNAATLTVSLAPIAPAFITQPADATVAAPATASFTVAVTGTPMPTLQWQLSTDGGTTWSDVSTGSGATSTTYTTPATVRATDNGAQFRVVITNAVSSVTSNPATLTVLSPVTAKAWGAGQIVRAGGGQTTTAAEMAMDGNGNALVVWGQELSTSSSRVDIWSNRYAVGSGWGTAQVLEANDSSSTGNQQPQIAADAAGNAITVWVQFDGSLLSVWANRYTAGSGWGTAQLIETGSLGGATSPNIAVDGSGNALAIWSQSDGTRYNIWANRYTVGSGWGTAELIETDNAGDAGRVSAPQIAFDAGGNALAVWEQNEGTLNNIWSNRYNAGSGWGTAQLIETDNAGRARLPSLAVDAGGNALAVWEQSDGTLNNIWANRYTAGSGWGTAQLIETDGAGIGASEAYVAFDASGNALATWTQNDASNRHHIQFNRYTAGVGWGIAATAVPYSVGAGPFGARFAFDSSGAALAVWNSTDGTNNVIGFGRYTAAGGWILTGGASGSGGQSVLPRIAVDGSGNAVAVWANRPGPAGNSGVFSVWAARYQ